MLSIGQSAAALEAHIERSREAQRKDDGEDFARRVSLLMDSMHSASIDVQKILSDEVDEKAWGAYLKGNRGVFTRRAVRCIGGTESRSIAAHYESDHEFQKSVNRYVHDFEAMLRRVLAERDGGMMAVTLMSADMGKLYAALAQGGRPAPLGWPNCRNRGRRPISQPIVPIGVVEREHRRRSIAARSKVALEVELCGALSAWPGTLAADFLVGPHPERQQQERAEPRTKNRWQGSSPSHCLASDSALTSTTGFLPVHSVAQRRTASLTASRIFSTSAPGS